MMALSIISFSLTTNAAHADDTERLASCVARADIATTAAADRDAGLSVTKAVELIEEQRPDEPSQQIERIVGTVYREHQFTPDETSTNLLQGCFDLE